MRFLLLSSCRHSLLLALIQPTDRRPDFRVLFDAQDVFENVVPEATAVGALGLPGLLKQFGNIHAEADGAGDGRSWLLLYPMRGISTES